MSKKKVAFGPRPTGMNARPSPVAISSWVEGQGSGGLASVSFGGELASSEAASRIAVAAEVPMIPEAPELPKKPEVVEEQKVATPAVVVQEKVKRLTIDIPDSLHRRVKSRCGQEGLKMADVIRELLEKRFKEA